MISILTPSRGRPAMLVEMITSAPGCEHIVWLDDDDESDYGAVLPPTHVVAIRGQRKPLGKCWNDLAMWAHGDYLMMGNDDLIFRSQDFEQRLAETIPPDVPAVACFDDGINGARHFAFPIVTRAWYEALGYFTPECFNYGYTDTWIHDVAKRAGCALYIGDVLVEHMHPTVGKRPVDLTFMERDFRGDPEAFRDTAGERAEDAHKIREAISERLRINK